LESQHIKPPLYAEEQRFRKVQIWFFRGSELSLARLEREMCQAEDVFA